MDFTVLIPARLASTRLPNKPLVDIAGVPMVVRVAWRAAQSHATAVRVAADDEQIVAACQAHGVTAFLTRPDHVTGSDRLAEACELLQLPDDAVVVNVQGDEPLIEPDLINACARALINDTEAVMSTAACAVQEMGDFINPNVVKVVCNKRQQALYFSRAPIPWWRDGMKAQHLPQLPEPFALRHIGLYAYRAGFLRQFPQLACSPLESVEMLEQLRVLWHGYKIAVHVEATNPPAGVDTPQDLARVRALLEGDKV